MRAESNFFIGIETYTHFSVFDFGMRQEVLHGRNNFSNTCFVVCTKKGVSVSDNDVFSHVAKEFWEFFHTRHNAGFCIKHNVGAIIVFHNARTHILARSIGTRVHVSYEPNGGYFFVDVGRKSGIYISHFIHFHFRQSNGFQFFYEIFCQSKLLLRAGGGGAVFVALRVETYIFKKTVYNVRHFIIVEMIRCKVIGYFQGAIHH